MTWRSFAIAFVGLALIAALTPSLRAGIRGPGKYCGAVIYDRWGGCTLYSGVYVMYVSESIKEQLRPHASQCVAVNATDVNQPGNPGDGLIRKIDSVGPARKARSESCAPLDGLKLTARLIGEHGNPPRVRLELTATGDHSVEVHSDMLAPTLLVKAPSQRMPLAPFDGPSFALVTRESFAVGWDKPRWHDECWTIGEQNALPRKFTLAPGESRTIEITFTLPRGEYEFIGGYGGGTHEGRLLISEQVPFDVNADPPPASMPSTTP